MLKLLADFIHQIDGLLNVDSDEACGEACLDNDYCNWYTSFPEEDFCALYSTCQIEEDICDDCYTSERDCAQGGPDTGGQGIGFNLLLC